MIVGLVQFAPVLGDKRRNFERVYELIGNSKIDLLVLPELFSTGYFFIDRDELESLAEPFGYGETSRFLFDLACKIDGAVVGGFVEKDGDRIFNSAGFFAKDGTSFLYRKSHLFGFEKTLYEPGDTGAVVVDYLGVKFGLAICFDWFFPEFFRTLALMGAQIIAHCANLIMPYFQSAAPIRSIENRVFIVSANRTGKEIRDGKVIAFTGRSIITAPSGEILILADKDAESLFTVEIDPREANDKNITRENHIFNDRRPEIYKL